MPKFRMIKLPVLLAAGAIALPLLASTTSAVAASPRTTPPIGAQLAELTNSGLAARDYFGSSVAIAGTTAIVGAWGYGGSAGRAYVFTETAGSWKQTAELKGSDTVAGDYFGISVAIAGTTAIVGAWGHAKSAGRAYVFTETAGNWKQTAELKGSDTVADDDFGSSVAIAGATAIVGAEGHAVSAGRAYAFTETAGSWKQTAELKGSDTVAGDYFGNSLAISGTTAIVGAEHHAGSAGRAYVFTETAAVWKQAAELKGSDTVAGDYFGNSVAISGTTAIVGARRHTISAGRAYVFTDTAGSWKQTAELKGSDTTSGDGFGTSVAISATTALVGSDHGDAGRAYVFTKPAAVWKQAAELKGSDTVAGDAFGRSVAISSTIAVVGAECHASCAGRAYVFEA